MTFQAQQDDVFVVHRVPMPARVGTAVGNRGRVVLAEGAASGHTHEVVAAATDHDGRPAAQLFEEIDGELYLLVERACVLTHEEHAPVAVAPGCYRVTIQGEYEPDGIRNALD